MQVIVTAGFLGGDSPYSSSLSRSLPSADNSGGMAVVVDTAGNEATVVVPLVSFSRSFSTWIRLFSCVYRFEMSSGLACKLKNYNLPSEKDHIVKIN